MKKNRLKQSSFFNSRQFEHARFELGIPTLSTPVAHFSSHMFKHITICLIACNIIACSTTHKPAQQKPTQPSSTPQTYTPNTRNYNSSYVCQNPSSYKNKVIGDGSCVSLIKKCSFAPDTRYWSAGEKVLSLPPGSIPEGSIIATFRNGKYPSMRGYHAAIYISHDENGIWVWDQWLSMPVHKRLIRLRKDKANASNSAQAYRLVK